MRAWWVALVCFVGADRLPFHSWEPPFTEFGENGDRIISQVWKASGTAVVNNNFVRLTPDRQSKRGALWSRKALGVNTVSCVLKLRISGQGAKFYGDGLALWFVHQGYYVEGDMHGSVEGFTGFGIIFDTFDNAESGTRHRDVTIVTNDGKGTQETMLQAAVGCNAKVRYHEARADFSIESSSRARVVVEGTQLKVQMDASSSGAWTDCAETTLPFEADWLEKAHVGVSASTGHLADNHDVISLVSYSDVARHAVDDQEAVGAARFSQRDGIDDARFERIEDTINSLMAKFEHVGHHLEHEMEAVEDHMRNTVGKLQAQEKQADNRIDELERLVVKNVESSMKKRISALESDMERHIENHAGDVERTLNAKISESVDVAASMGGSGWRFPFFLLLIFDGIAVYALWQWYFKIRKSHLL